MPALNVDAVKLTIRGDIMAVQDWSTSLWIRTVLAGGTWALDDMQAVIDDWRGYVATWWGVLKGFSSGNTRWLGVTGYFYPAGDTTALQSAISDAPAAVAGTGATYHPSTVALVASLRTDLSGRSNRGRSYLPFNGQALAADYQTSQANCLTMAETYGDLIRAINGYNGTAHDITSQFVGVASHTTGQVNNVSRVVVNSKPDTQRRRADETGVTYTESEVI